jgi:hypothetical protein
MVSGVEAAVSIVANIESDRRDQLLNLFGGQPLVALHSDPKPDRGGADGAELAFLAGVVPGWEIAQKLWLRQLGGHLR